MKIRFNLHVKKKEKVAASVFKKILELISFFTMLAIIFICSAAVNTVQSTYSDIDLNGFTTGSQGFKILGSSIAALGHVIKPVGDFNGDGEDDIIFASDVYNRVFLLFGRIGNVESTVTMGSFVSSASTGIRIHGGTRIGLSIDGAGDVNGDGYDDIVVSDNQAPYSGKNNAGAAYIIFGRPNSQVWTTPTNSCKSFMLSI